MNRVAQTPVWEELIRISYEIYIEENDSEMNMEEFMDKVFNDEFSDDELDILWEKAKVKYTKERSKK